MSVASGPEGGRPAGRRYCRGCGPADTARDRPSTGGRTVEVREPIGLGHKVALRRVAYGRARPQVRPDHRLRVASRFPPGRWSTSITSRRTCLSATTPSRPSGRSSRGPTAADVRGYLRPDGRVGTRNYIAVISTVNCSASTSRYIADRFRDGAWREDFPNVDGVFAITHKGGCGLPFEGPDHQILERVLAGFANHPNVAAYVIVGLGCEVGFAQHLVDAQDLVTLCVPAERHGAGTGHGPGRSTSRNRVVSPGRSRRP